MRFCVRVIGDTDTDRYELYMGTGSDNRAPEAKHHGHLLSSTRGQSVHSRASDPGKPSEWFPQFAS